MFHKAKLFTIVLTGFVVFFANCTKADVLTFDDIGTPEESTLIPDGYGGFDWDYFYYRNIAEDPIDSGGKNGLVSGDYLAHNSGYFNLVGLSGNLFTFQGAWLAASWRDELNVQIDGYLNNNLVYTNTVVVNTTNSIWYEMNYVNIDKLEFSSFGGTPHEGYSHDGYHFVMDNFTYIPEPATILLFIFGELLLRRIHKPL